MEEFDILYFAFVSASFGGVEQKIFGQFDALRHIHPDTHLFLVSSTPPGERLAAEMGKREQVKALVNTAARTANPFARRKEKFELIGQELKGFDPDTTLIYFRYPNADFIFLDFLKRHKAWRFVTEHQEIENAFSRYKFNGNYLRNTFEMVWGKAVRRHITAFVGVTEEIKNYELSVEGSGAKKSIAVGNSINVESYPLRKPLATDMNQVKILFVGAGFRTHGLFRLITSVSQYKANLPSGITLKVKVAGDSPEMAYNRQLAQQEKVDDYFDFLGMVQKDQLGELFNWADIGVGSLGLHRIGLSQSSTLKAREYVARGLPFFWSTHDHDIPNHLPFILAIEANDNPFDLLKVIVFAQKCKSEPELGLQMREYAENNLSTTIQIQKLYNFFKQLQQTALPQL